MPKVYKIAKPSGCTLTAAFFLIGGAVAGIITGVLWFDQEQAVSYR